MPGSTRVRPLGAVVAMIVSLLAGKAVAQTVAPAAPSVVLDRFSPSEAGAGWFTADELRWRGHLTWVAGVVTDEAYRPLVARSSTRAPDQIVVSNQLTTHLQGALTIAERYRVAISLPLVLVESGDAAVVGGTTYPTPGAGVGDPRLGGSVRLFQDWRGRVSGAAGLQLDIPVFLGGRRYGREGSLRARPYFAVAGERDWLAYAGRVGLLVHAPRDLSSELPLGTNLEIGGAVGARLWNRRVLVGPELYASTMLDGDGPFTRRSTPLELLLGAHYHHESGFGGGLGLGGGLSQATGSPEVRFVFSLSFAPVGGRS
jgi:OOP family OmpA-OmpF porin